MAALQLFNNDRDNFSSALNNLISEVRETPANDQEVVVSRHTIYYALEIIAGLCNHPSMGDEVERIAEQLQKALNNLPVVEPPNAMATDVMAWLKTECARQNATLVRKLMDSEAENAELKAEVKRLKEATTKDLEQVPHLVKKMRDDANGGTAITAIELEKASDAMEDMLIRVVKNEAQAKQMENAEEALKTLGIVKTDLGLIVRNLDFFYKEKQEHWIGALDDAHVYAETAIIRIDALNLNK